MTDQDTISPSLSISDISILLAKSQPRSPLNYTEAEWSRLLWTWGGKLEKL